MTDVSTVRMPHCEVAGCRNRLLDADTGPAFLFTPDGVKLVCGECARTYARVLRDGGSRSVRWNGVAVEASVFFLAGEKA